MTHVELLVEVREFASGIFKEEAATNGECGSKQVRKENREKGQNRCPVSVEEDPSVRGHEPQLVEEPKAVGEQDGDGE